MKKRFVKITAMLLAAIVLSSCTLASSAGIKADSSVEKMLGFSREEDKYTSALTETSQLCYSTYIENGKETAIAKPIAVDIKIPAEWTQSSTNIYQTLNSSAKNTILCMKAPDIYKKPENFKLDETVHAALASKGVTASLAGWRICSYKTAAGYNSIIYYDYDKEADTFSIYAYIELDDDYVAAVNIHDSYELRGQMLDIIDSLSLGTYDDFSDYGTAELGGYMNYLVNYFHEPYKIGDDVSDINVMYLCFLYAYSNRASYYDIGYDLERQAITIPLSRMDEICTALIGDDVDITSFEEKHMHTAETGNGEYGGVDGIGYIFNTATDYWWGDPWHIDYEKFDEPIEITENENIITVKAHIYRGLLGEYEDPRTLEYTFEETAVKDEMGNGFIYHRLLEIKEL